MSRKRRHKQRTQAACEAAAVAAQRANPWQADTDRLPEYMPNFSLNKWIVEGRREMGEERWAKLNAEWEQGE